MFPALIQSHFNLFPLKFQILKKVYIKQSAEREFTVTIFAMTHLTYCTLHG